jgi:hypothetical protein
MSVNGDDERQLLPSIYDRDFAVSSEGIYFGMWQNHSMQLNFLEFKRSIIHRIAEFDHDFIGLSVSPRQKSIIYACMIGQGGNIMLAQSTMRRLFDVHE